MADQKLSALTEATSANAGDIFYFVTDTGGTPTSLKISKQSLFTGYATTDLVAGKVDTSTQVIAGSGLVGGGALGGNVDLSVSTNVRDKTFVFFAAGNLVGGQPVESFRAYVPFNMSVINMRGALGKENSGSTAVVAVKTFGTPNAAGVVVGSAVFADSAFVAINSSDFSQTVLYAGSWLGLAITGSGSVQAGSNLTLTLVSRSS